MAVKYAAMGCIGRKTPSSTPGCRMAANACGTAARSGLQQPELRVGLGAVGSCPHDRQIGVGGVEHGDQRSLLDLRPFGHRALEKPARHLGRNLYFGRFNLSGHAHTVGRRCARAGDGAAQSDSKEEQPAGPVCREQLIHDVCLRHGRSTQKPAGASG